MNIIGPQVRALREAKCLTQEVLAEQCQALGWEISRGTLAKVEAQVRRVTDEDIVRLADALGVKISRLFD